MTCNNSPGKFLFKSIKVLSKVSKREFSSQRHANLHFIFNLLYLRNENFADNKFDMRRLKIKQTN